MRRIGGESGSSPEVVGPDAPPPDVGSNGSVYYREFGEPFYKVDNRTVPTNVGGGFFDVYGVGGVGFNGQVYRDLSPTFYTQSNTDFPMVVVESERRFYFGDSNDGVVGESFDGDEVYVAADNNGFLGSIVPVDGLVYAVYQEEDTSDTNLIRIDPATDTDTVLESGFDTSAPNILTEDGGVLYGANNDFIFGYDISAGSFIFQESFNSSRDNAIGSDYIAVTSDSDVLVYDKTGTQLGSVTLPDDFIQLSNISNGRVLAHDNADNLQLVDLETQSFVWPNTVSTGDRSGLAIAGGYYIFVGRFDAQIFSESGEVERSLRAEGEFDSVFVDGDRLYTQASEGTDFGQITAYEFGDMVQEFVAVGGEWVPNK